MTDAEFWEVERSLWLGGPEAFRAWVAAECLMVFPAPAGILDGPAILEGLAAAPRWERVEMSGRRSPAQRRGGGGARLPRGGAARRDGVPHSALCSSTYVALAGDWWLVQHQQTPA